MKNSPFGLPLHPMEVETIRRVQKMGFLGNVQLDDDEGESESPDEEQVIS